MARCCYSCINIHIHSCLTQWSNETHSMFKSWVSRAVRTSFRHYIYRYRGRALRTKTNTMDASLQFWPKLGQHVSFAGADESEKFILTDIKPEFPCAIYIIKSTHSKQNFYSIFDISSHRLLKRRPNVLRKWTITVQ